jgi:DNA-binding IclR family transcriptional regulator
MSELIGFAPDGTVMLLCRSFSDSVVCVHQIVRGQQPPISYERGRLRPLFRGATSKSILAFTPVRRLKKIYQTYAPEIAQAGLGSDQNAFLAAMRLLRKPGYVTANAEVDPGRFGISAPVLHRDRGAIGSLSYVIGADQADERTINRLAPVLVAGAREIERTMDAASADEPRARKPADHPAGAAPLTAERARSKNNQISVDGGSPRDKTGG